jgi:hypothetical protein
MSKTLLIFDSNLAKVSISINLNRLDDKKEWYYLKNNKEENIISILTSIHYEINNKQGSIIETNINNNCNNSYISPGISNKHGHFTNIVNKNDMSCDMIRFSNNVNSGNFFNLMNKNSGSILHSNNNNVTYSNINHINSILNNMDPSNELNNNHNEILQGENINNISANYPNTIRNFRNNHNNKLNIDNTVIYNDNYKSPDLSTISNNMFSPYSYRIDPEKSQLNFNLTKLNISNNMSSSNIKMKSMKQEDLEFFTNIDNFLDNKLFGENFGSTKEECLEIIAKLKQKYIHMKKDEEKIKKAYEEIHKNKESKL